MKKLLQVFLLSYLLILSGCSTSEPEEPKQEEQQEEIVEQKNTKEAETSNTEVEVYETSENTETFSVASLPAFSNSPFIEINNNVPEFETYEIQEATTSYETYSQLDSLGRCQEAQASIGQDLMPTEDRESLSAVTPSGWDNERYSCVDGGWIYNRSHLIGFQLTGEQANALNLITGTRYMNVEGMLPFENQVANYVKSTGNHVLYEVTPIYEGDNLVASGVQMEAYSVEDQGQGVQFNVYCYNVQPGININYANGDTQGTGSCVLSESNNSNQNTSTPAPTPEANGQTVYVSRTGSKYHSNPNCSNMKNPSSMTMEEAQARGSYHADFKTNC